MTSFALRSALVAVGLALLGGCASLQPVAPHEAPREATREPIRADGAAVACREAFARIDEVVADDGASDAMASRIPDFPYLRVDRLLASYRNEIATPAAERFWVDRMLQLDREARGVELANLRRPAQAQLMAALARSAGTGGDEAMGASGAMVARSGGADTVLDLVTRCGQLLREADDRDPARIAALKSRAVVPDDYSLAMRGLGLYPLTSFVFARGIRGWQRENDGVFATPVEALPLQGLVWSYAPSSGEVAPRARIAEIIARSTRNPLGIPLPSGADLETLVRTFAPIYEIDTRTDDDRLGAPRLDDDARASIDTRRPTLYVRTTATRVGDRALLQIVYTGWFPARPKAGALDLLGGRLDGLLWRVTLGPDGVPLVFDTIHPCGCYHMFFPSPAATPKPAPDAQEEFVYVPQRLPVMPEGTRAVLRVEARTHYLQRVSFEPAGPRAIGYELASDDDLRSLSTGIGLRRSLYGPDGIVPGTERSERWTFWPMGIASAGAMRQAGRHATAFVGRRHFDDARLLDERFRFDPPPR